MIEHERNTMLANALELTNGKQISDMPLVLKKWLAYSGIDDTTNIKNVRVVQTGGLKLKPGQEQWYKATSDQYFTITPPAFNWSVKVNPLIHLRGRDKFERGRGNMLIKLFSLFSVVNIKDNDKINQATLQRYLAEIVWFPAAALCDFIQWKQIDKQTAEATMSYEGVSGSGTFSFDEDGRFTTFTAMRYNGASEDSELKRWIVKAGKEKIFNGITLPAELKVTWSLENQDWNWLKLEIIEVEYNV